MEIEKITVIIIPTRIIIAIMMMILIMKVTIASIMILNTSLLIWRNKWQNDSNGNCITGNNENDKLQTSSSMEGQGINKCAELAELFLVCVDVKWQRSLNCS